MEFTLLYVFTAICFLLYGLHLTEEGLRNAAGDRLRFHLGRMTTHRVTGFLMGALVTLIFQSSTATAVTLIGMTRLGLLTARQSAAVLLGADVGTTLLVILLASLVRSNALAVAQLTLVIGFASTFFLRHNRDQFYAQAILGFGFVFFGLSLISRGSLALGGSTLVRELLSAVSGNPTVGLLIGAVLTGIFQSSAAILGMILSFAGAGILSIQDAVPFVLGANLGAGIGPFLASLGAPPEGKKVAYLHIAFKVIGVLCFLPFASEIANLATKFVAAVPFQVAAVHIGFNLTLAVVFLPVIPLLVKSVSRFVPEVASEEKFGPVFLDEKALDNPALAFANVFREILRMAEIGQEMCSKALIPFQEVSGATKDRLEELDDRIDLLDKKIKFYLAKVSQSQLTPEQAQRELALMTITHDLESIGDVITNDLMELAEKKRRKNVSFSPDGWADIEGFHRMVLENFHLATTALATNELELGNKVMRHKRHLSQVEQDLAQKHLLRLHQGHRESFETSSIHLDLLTHLRRVNSLVCKLAYPVLGERRS